mmetsp:Transcript_58864/g.164425  ORF Transcript_58864/g.164425 Transcript_58864/m.164425 type:complete len:293 (-) Transcript_58864:109-987(-)
MWHVAAPACGLRRHGALTMASSRSLRPFQAVPVVVPLVLAVLAVLPHRAFGHIRGIRMVGDVQEPARAIFQSDAAVTTVAADGGTVRFLQAGGSGVSLSQEIAQMPDAELTGELEAGTLEVGGVPQWALYDLDTFDDVAGGFLARPGASWSRGEPGFCGSPNDQFLGGPCRLAAGSSARNYTELPQHSRLRVRARVHFIDRWHGESVTLAVDGAPVWSQSHSWCRGFLKWMCKKYGIDTCGRDTPDRLSVHVDATLRHSAPTLELAFASSLPPGTDACDTSWGFDDVSVELL